jgi:molybdopterin converting factor small subunit
MPLMTRVIAEVRYFANLKEKKKKRKKEERRKKRKKTIINVIS